jgi:hypothetical protein
MTNEPESSRCAAPSLGRYLTPYCFGDATEEEREAFGEHLLECDCCWEEVQQLEAAIRLLREDSTLMEPVVAADAVFVLGLSRKLDSLVAGHVGHALAMSAGYSVLCALGLLAEVAYAFDRYGRDALRVAAVIVVVVVVASLAGFGVAWSRTRAGKTDGLAWSIASILAGIGAAYVAGAAILPPTPIVVASFQTFTAQAGYLKSLLQTLPLSLFLMLLPFHSIVALQRELKEGRYQSVKALLNGAPDAIPPRGSVLLRPRMLAVFVAALAGVGLYMLSHLLENLQSSPYRNLFTLIAECRATLYLVLAVLGVVWYYRTLNELRREATAMTELRSRRVR